jgi:uncharacterized protein YndB with AHSA1/START domain
MKLLLIVGGLILALVVVVLIVGWMLPVKHQASRSATVAGPPEQVWRLVTEVDAFPTWRSDVKTVTRLPDRDGHIVWVEEGSNGRMTMAVERSEAPRQLVTRIADPDLPFGGTWTYVIAPAPNGTTLTITEDGEVYNPIFRFMSRFVFGHEATMAAYLSAAEKKLEAGR